MTERVLAVESAIRGILTVEIPDRIARAFGVLTFIVLIALGAHLKVFMPGNPVPMTFQTLFVLLAGAMLGSRYGALAVFSYLTLGVVGLPMFATGAGQLLGPTSGYLAGFFIAVLIVGSLAHGTKSGFRLAIALILGEITILGLGYLNLAIVYRMGFERAFLLGVLPFLVGDALKCVLAWVLLNMVSKYRFKVL